MTPYLRRLSNGVTILSTPIIGSKTISGQLFLSAGSRYETTGQQGLFHLAEHVVAATLVQALRRRGLTAAARSINADCFDRRTVFTFTCLPKEFSAVLSIVTEVMTMPTLVLQHITTERNRLLRELAGSTTIPSVRFAKVWRAHVFASTPLARSQSGTLASVRRLSATIVAAAIKKYYQPQRACVSIAGNIPRTLVKTADSPLALWSNHSLIGVDPIQSIVPFLCHRAGTIKQRADHSPTTRVDYTVIVPLKTVAENIVAELALQAIRNQIFPSLRKNFSRITIATDFITYPGMLVASIDATLSTNQVTAYQQALPTALQSCGRTINPVAMSRWQQQHIRELTHAYRRAVLVAQIQGFYYSTFGRIVSYQTEKKIVQAITHQTVATFLRRLTKSASTYWTILPSNEGTRTSAP